MASAAVDPAATGPSEHELPRHRQAVFVVPQALVRAAVAEDR